MPKENKNAKENKNSEIIMVKENKKGKRENVTLPHQDGLQCI